MLPRVISPNNCCYICQHNIGRIIILEQQHQSFAALTSLEWLALLLFSFLFTGTVFTVEWLRESLFTSCPVFLFAQIFLNATSPLALLLIYFVLLQISKVYGHGRYWHRNRHCLDMADRSFFWESITSVVHKCLYGN